MWPFKRNKSSLELIRKQFSTKKELSAALEAVVKKALSLRSVISAELSLIDSGQYHSAISVGVPILGKPVHDIPLVFAGSELGRIRLTLKKNLSTRELALCEELGLESTLIILSSEYTKELLKMKRVSEESIRAKTGFLANLSHEIRGPLGVMLNGVDLVLEGLCGPLNEDQQESLLMVRSNGKHLLSLINDVLDYAKVESGKLEAKPVPFNLKEGIEEVMALLRSQAHSKQHQFLLTSAPEDIFIKVDPKHFRQIMINIISNAIKYTPEGGRVELSASIERQGKVAVHVKDTGVGIPESEREKVFQAFERLQDDYSQKQVGTGLGMSLTKKLVELNGGFIEFTSVRGKGSTFSITFPITQDRPVERSPETVKVAGAGRGILVAAHDQPALKPIVRYLARAGFKLAYGVSREEITKVISTEPVCAILIDQGWFDNYGAEELKAIRVLSPKLPIALLTNRAFSFDVEDSLKAGVDRLISQPIELPELALILDELTKRRTGELGRILNL
jgi:signal transduction histidine kinase/CheY-like chemotaxis protein